ncbi:MAG TPA: alpha/beta hydrolase [Acidimicrobiales bacterium]|jgi:pimeloyl-ACP methyl ester carboxylesterase|nr:alpha/beta hydrolase [Acidimicrobiales bacterium]
MTSPATTELWVQEVGEGPLVVLVHGAMDRSSSFLRVRRLLEGECRVVRYDRRGYGRSLAAGPPVSFDQQVDDLAAVIRDRHAAVLVGHSLGGVVCLALAERSPGQVGAVLAYEAPMMWEPWWPTDSAGSAALASSELATGDGDGGEGDGAAAEAFMRRMLGNARWERLPAAVRAERRAEGATLLAELRSVRPPSRVPYNPERVTVPVVAAFGTETQLQHRRAAQELGSRAPRGVLEAIEGAGHGAHLSHPVELAALVRGSLSLAPGRR